jgi:hypothetical protein
MGEHLGHLKDIGMSKYTRESNGRVPINNYPFIYVNCYLIWFSKY